MTSYPWLAAAKYSVVDTSPSKMEFKITLDMHTPRPDT